MHSYYGCTNITNLPMHILCYLANSLESFEYVWIQYWAKVTFQHSSESVFNCIYDNIIEELQILLLTYYIENIPGKKEIWRYVIIRLTTFVDILFIHTIQKTFPTESIFVCKLCCKRHYLMMVKLKHLDTNILNTRLISRNGQCAMIYRKWRKLPWESYQQSWIQDVSLNIY